MSRGGHCLRENENKTSRSQIKGLALNVLNSFLTSVTLHSSDFVPCHGGRQGVVWSFLMWSLIFCTRSLWLNKKKKKHLLKKHTIALIHSLTITKHTPLPGVFCLYMISLCKPLKFRIGRYCGLNPKQHKGLLGVCCRGYVKLKHVSCAFTCSIKVLLEAETTITHLSFFLNGTLRTYLYLSSTHYLCFYWEQSVQSLQHLKLH